MPCKQIYNSLSLIKEEQEKVTFFCWFSLKVFILISFEHCYSSTKTISIYSNYKNLIWIFFQDFLANIEQNQKVNNSKF
jgi:hypothetical protein